MDPEVAAGFEEIRQTLRQVSDIVFSLARTSSEHDEKLDKVNATIASLATEHEQKFSRILDILAALAESDEELHEADERLRQNLEKHDEQLGVLIKMMDEWVRRQQPGA